MWCAEEWNGRGGVWFWMDWFGDFWRAWGFYAPVSGLAGNEREVEWNMVGAVMRGMRCPIYAHPIMRKRNIDVHTRLCLNGINADSGRNKTRIITVMCMRAHYSLSKRKPPPHEHGCPSPRGPRKPGAAHKRHPQSCRRHRDSRSSSRGTRPAPWHKRCSR